MKGLVRIRRLHDLLNRVAKDCPGAYYCNDFGIRLVKASRPEEVEVGLVKLAETNAGIFDRIA